MRTSILESRQNVRIKDIVHLKQRKERESRGLCLIEGYRELNRAFASGFELESIYYCPQFFSKGTEKDYDGFLNQLESLKIPIFECRDHVFEKISHRENPDGLFAIGVTREKTLSDLILSPKALLIVAEGIEKPGNLGNLIRTAEAVHADGLILSESRIDLWNPNVIRASQGLVFQFPVLTTHNRDVAHFLKDNKIMPLVATPQAQTAYWDTDLKQSIAVILGTEDQGVSPFWLQESFLQVQIPMQGEGDSLNVGIAGALILYEALRQRS